MGGLAIPCIATKAEALFVRQTCRLLNNEEHNSRRHINYWIGTLLKEWWPDMGQGIHAQNGPPYIKHLHDLLEVAIDREVIDVNNLKLANAKNIYKDYTTTFPTPKIMDKYQLPWNDIFKRLWNPVLEPPVQSLMFLLIHNILPVRTRLFRLKLANDNKCLEDHLEEDVEHVFCHCVKTRECWQWVRWKITDELIPVNFPVPSDFELLNLCFESPLEKEIIWIVQHQSNWTKQT